MLLSDKLVLVAISVIGSFIGKLEENNIDIQQARGKEGYGFIEEALIEIIDQIKDQLKVGFPEFGIPSLDPLNINELPLDVNFEKIIKSKWHVADATLSGLMGFDVTDLKIDLSKVDVDYEVTFKNLNLVTRYNVTGKILNFLELFGDGIIGINLQSFSLKGSISLVSQCEMLVLSKFSVFPKLGSANFVFTGLMNSNKFGEFLANELRTLVPKIINTNSEKINAGISPTVINLLNRVLAFVQFDVSKITF